MALTSTAVLFQRPQHQIASLIRERIALSSATSIVTGFLTPAGLALLEKPILEHPARLKNLVVGAATYPAFQALDNLTARGLSSDRIRIHLGHTFPTGGKKNPFARYHPMLHSKIYYMELQNDMACAFIGSHNLTAFALGGLNGEASVLIEGRSDAQEFIEIREHIKIAAEQAAPYDPGMKEAFAWWFKQAAEGLTTEIALPVDWLAIRTIVIFAKAEKSERLRPGDQLYFEIPRGIEQISTLKTEVHLFLFSALPSNPWQALSAATTADASYTCLVLGAENDRGNLEVAANWRIEARPIPKLVHVASGQYRPKPFDGMQQVRAEVHASSVQAFEYLFERDRKGWDPQYSEHDEVRYSSDAENADDALPRLVDFSKPGLPTGSELQRAAAKLVFGLAPRLGPAKEADEAALKLAAPESGSFVLVSLRRRKVDG